MSEVNNIDSLLVKDMQNAQAPVQAIPEVSNPTASVPEEKVPRGTLEPTNSVDNGSKTVDIAENIQTPPESTQTNENKPDIAATEAKSNIDEYGNPVEPPKTYTEDEVQRMIRDRLSRGRFADQPTPQQVQKTADEFKTDPNSEETWETQLEAFVEKTIEKRQVKQTEQQWKQQEAARQAEFEAKFSSGMSKYQDFHSVVAGKPITDSMMLAARNLENPAAFIYGASKLHPQELDRISRIADPYAQAAEVGRLHERMVKTRAALSNAPKPLEAPKSDLTAKKVDERPSIDYLIAAHAKQKAARR